ncbi:MAG: TIGR00300 family protein [Chloroflexi bacterium]|nr:MAG: TIGR00300 family protein [Chloroflexota bacterium]TME17676.1 MAG: TIGR00300 family protein [Chloroflexota bacterium]TME19252.1 MAG: TIGR00300 family protein [Chloroflexota bacterium]
MSEPRQTALLVLEGHIIDSLILPQVMDMVMDEGGNFTVEELRVGQHKNDTSYCRIQVAASTAERLDRIVKRARELGAAVAEEAPATLEAIPKAGVFPEGFYSTSNLPTLVLLDGSWVTVERQEMDCAIAVDEKAGRAWCIAFSQAQPGMRVVVGHQGVRVMPLERSRQVELFSFMTSGVSIEKPKKRLISEIAGQMKQIRKDGGRILVVGGPAIIHTGSGRYLSRLIELGFVQVLFAGNALAAHDIEAALYGTSLGINLESGLPIESGHEHHMRAINRVRAAGSIQAMVESGQLTSGVMKAALDHGVEVVLGGSVRDDGPLPDVITDVIEAQERMRAALPDVRMALMLSTMLHSIATGNLLPAAVHTVCVDMNPAVVTKLADRGSWQSIGLVTDVDSFLRELVLALEAG